MNGADKSAAIREVRRGPLASGPLRTSRLLQTRTLSSCVRARFFAGVYGSGSAAIPDYKYTLQALRPRGAGGRPPDPPFRCALGFPLRSAYQGKRECPLVNTTHPT